MGAKSMRVIMKVAEQWARCEYCGKPMSHGCIYHSYVIDGKGYDAIKFGDSREQLPEDIEVCHDCNARIGEYHHPGCDMERCPKCGCQLISCNCHVEDIMFKK